MGSCDQRIFGLRPGDRLERQYSARDGLELFVEASAVLGDATIHWLLEHPGNLLVTPSGRPLAIAVPPAESARARSAIEGGPSSYPSLRCDEAGTVFIRKLRRRTILFARSLSEEPKGQIERALFENVYKGVTDLVTKWVWPVPAFWIVRAAAKLGIPPNAITGVSILLTLVAAWLFYEHQFLPGLAAAWLMTLLDTVDGKLARVTVTSSKLGNQLDHVTDVVHPPLWWICVAAGIEALDPARAPMIWMSCWIILGTYFAGRWIETAFKRRIGFNQYLWRPFDSAFRLIVSRRNVVLLILSVGYLTGNLAWSYAATAGWSAISVAIQLVILVQALAARARHPLTSWLM